MPYLSTGQDWPCSVVKVVGQTPAGTTVQPRYYISSLEAPAELRTHCQLESGCDLCEDHCRIRKDAPQTLRQGWNETSLVIGSQGTC